MQRYLRRISVTAGEFWTAQGRQLPGKNGTRWGCIVIRVPSRKILKAATCVIVAVGLILFADWRDWIKWPDLLSASYSKFDRFEIEGEAPWCSLFPPSAVFAHCHYLSKEHCERQNYVLITMGDPDERAVCVPNPLK